MERMVARTPDHRTFIGILVSIGLALNAWIHDMIATDRTVIHMDI